MIKGLFFILLFYFLGESFSILIGGFMPGSVIGMILLFLCLYFKILNPNIVKDAATVITKNMAVFFIPAAVGVMTYTQLISQSIWVISIAIILSTLLTMASVAFVQEFFEKRKTRK